MSAVVATEQQSLDDILEMNEPYRTNAMREFLDSDEPIKLKASKPPFKIQHRGKTYNFGPAGRTLGRRTAVDLLRAFGKNGKYQGKDRATSITRNIANAIEAQDNEATKYWQKRGLNKLNFEERYLYHDVTASESDDEE